MARQCPQGQRQVFRVAEQRFKYRITGIRAMNGTPVCHLLDTGADIVVKNERIFEKTNALLTRKKAVPVSSANGKIDVL